MNIGMIGASDIVEAFNPKAVGTRVVDHVPFLKLLEEALRQHDPSKDRVPGQHFVELPADAVKFVSCGVGRHTGRPDDYVVREWRGAVQLFLRREFAAVADSVACVVYTREAYAKDPQVTQERLLAACPSEHVSHVIVAVLASVGPRPPVGLGRFVENFAGGNREYDLVTLAEEQTKQHNQGDLAGCLVDQITRLKKLAAESVEYARSWCTVAD